MRGKVASCKQGLSAFLKQQAPLWHQVGRVCFHLAENRRDPEYPFAFLATYAASITDGARVQYQPLSKALKEYAGARNKKALIKLLSPVHLASQSSPLVKELVDSGDIYQPLAWPVRQAYRFLKEVPVFEESGVLVRLPDWWKKRPRPRVGISIGEKRQKKFDAKGMLDFKVRLALGDQELTEAEWSELIAAEEGLVLLRGQWVEVDREKLTEALDHWKKVEQQASDGLSFVEGMRLLAGAPTDIVLTTYGMLLRQRWLQDVAWQLVILDEAQAVKNPAARQTKAVKRLGADARIALTGTPIENRLSDLWSLFDFLCPGLLGSQKKFKQFVKTLDARAQNRYAPLRGLVQPYILRRMKTDKRIIADLPDKTELRAFCGLRKRQAALYTKLVKELAKLLEGLDGMKRRGLVLALRQQRKRFRSSRFTKLVIMRPSLARRRTTVWRSSAARNPSVFCGAWPTM